ncbi:MAG: pyridoxal phosphate-dependent aminotransferase, partial [Hyphomicrobiaceae bacterium]
SFQGEDAMSARQNHSRLPVASRTEALKAGSSDAWAVHYAGTDMQEKGEDVIILTIGDPDFETPEPIAAEAMASIRRGETHYTPANGIPELREAIRQVESKRLGWDIPLECIVYTQGAQNGLYAVLQTIVEPGREVLSIDPAYPTFPAVIGGAGGHIVRVPLKETNGQFRFDAEAAERAITDRTCAFLFNFPHNPTGASLNREEAEAVVALCRRHNIWLVCDEVYAELTFDAPYVSPLSLPDARDTTISIRSMSKSHAMSGWRVGWSIAPAEQAMHIQNAANAMLFGGPEFVQRAAAAGLGLNIADEMRAAYQRRRDLLVEKIAASSHLKIIRPESGIFALIDVRPTGLSDEDFAWKLLRERNVAVLPAASFSELTEGFVRVSLCVPDDDLAEAADRIAALAGELATG